MSRAIHPGYLKPRLKMISRFLCEASVLNDDLLLALVGNWSRLCLEDDFVCVFGCVWLCVVVASVLVKGVESVCG
jgi:hypothetical protein